PLVVLTAYATALAYVQRTTERFGQVPPKKTNQPNAATNKELTHYYLSAVAAVVTTAATTLKLLLLRKLCFALLV
ncbi:unnamed protein product, partial [Ceratitis capitata]